MSNYSKAIAAVVGGLLSWAVARYALPAEWSSQDMVSAITLIITAALVYVSPKNTPSA